MTDKIIVLDGEDFLICSDIVVDDVNYLYVVSLDGTKYSILKREIENGEDTVESISDETLIKRIMEILSNQENN